METRDIARAAVLVALAVALSPLYIPVGLSKCYPAQHMINVIAAVVLGPVPALLIAFLASLIRNLLGLGTLLAFPGAMIGALLAGTAYRIFGKPWAAGLGEVVGTGLLGALVSAWLVGPLLLGKSMAVAGMVAAFGLSSAAGAAAGLWVLKFLRKVHVWAP
ncbi:MAG: energy coupling factor transporter S component ThiW [Desulfobacterales bacterium]|jgi:energy-coupling factor transport system ATP-binding protein|nr:energy coupling factor transporter S component ThiW [Desulfobacterales bacterium]